MFKIIIICVWVDIQSFKSLLSENCWLKKFWHIIQLEIIIFCLYQQNKSQTQKFIEIMSEVCLFFFFILLNLTFVIIRIGFIFSFSMFCFTV